MKSLFKIYYRIVLFIRTNRLIHYVIFGYMPGSASYGNYWDWTTLAIKKSMKSILESHHKVLDLGTGPYAVLAQFIVREYPDAGVIAADYLDELLNNAKREKSAGKIDFVCSDLFENIEGTFDVILFNAPYISNQDGSNLDIFTSKIAKQRWSGGESGLNTISRFLLNLADHLTPDGVCMLGVNHFYLKDTDVRREVLKNNSIKLADYYKNRFTQAGVYCLKRVDK